MVDFTKEADLIDSALTIKTCVDSTCRFLQANHPVLNEETVRQEVVWRGDCAARLNEFGPEPEFGFGTLEARLSKGVEEIIPVVTFGVAQPYVDLVVAGSHWGGTVKVTG